LIVGSIKFNCGGVVAIYLSAITTTEVRKLDNFVSNQ